MAVHDRVLQAARRICRARGSFRPAEVVAELPDLNPGSVRTHVMSRCCVNAPAHHPHRWPYFRRVHRGVYEILPAWRTAGAAARRPRASRSGRTGRKRRGASAPSAIRVEVREAAGAYVARSADLPREVRAGTLDGVAAGVLQLARERLRSGAVPVAPALVSLHVSLDLGGRDPVSEAYAADLDRTLIRENLRRSVEERIENLQRWVEATAAIRGAARRRGPEAGR